MGKLNWSEDSRFFRQKRKALGITQAKLAKLSGVKRGTIAAIEADHFALSFDVAASLWDALARVEVQRRGEVSVSERKLLDRVAELEKENTAYAAMIGETETASAIPAVYIPPTLRERLFKFYLEPFVTAKSHPPEKLASMVRELMEIASVALRDAYDSRAQVNNSQSQVKGYQSLAQTVADLRRLVGLRTEAIVKTEEADTLQSELEQREAHVSKDDEE
jgi:DNA-binding XRE family transcriptional regulator